MENECNERLPKVIRFGILAPKIIAVMAGNTVGLAIAIAAVDPLWELLQAWGWL